MKITVNRAALLAALKVTVPAAETRGTMPALACVRLAVDGRKLTIAATDLTVSATAEVPCVGDDGVALVGAGALLKVVDRLAGDEVRLTATGPNLEIASGRSKVVEPTLAANQAVKILQPDGPTSPVDPAALVEVLDACAPAICADETRFHLGGVQLTFGKDGNIRGASTDGHRAHLRAVDGKTTLYASAPVIVPGRALGLMRKVLDGAEGEATLALKGSHLWVRVGTVTIGTKLIDATFPPVEQVVPATPLAATLNKAELVGAIRRSALASSDARGLLLDLAGDEVCVSAADGDRSVRDYLKATATGPGKLVHCASPRYLLEAIQAVPGDDVSIYADDQLAPVLFAAAGADATFAAGSLAVVMPMRR
jgi:DNA polymerase-3 subunit beta